MVYCRVSVGCDCQPVYGVHVKLSDNILMLQKQQCADEIISVVERELIA